MLSMLSLGQCLFYKKNRLDFPTLLSMSDFSYSFILFFKSGEETFLDFQIKKRII